MRAGKTGSRTFLVGLPKVRHVLRGFAAKGVRSWVPLQKRSVFVQRIHENTPSEIPPVERVSARNFESLPLISQMSGKEKISLVRSINIRRKNRKENNFTGRSLNFSDVHALSNVSRAFSAPIIRNVSKIGLIQVNKNKKAIISQDGHVGSKRSFQSFFYNRAESEKSLSKILSKVSVRREIGISSDSDRSNSFLQGRKMVFALPVAKKGLQAQPVPAGNLKKQASKNIKYPNTARENNGAERQSSYSRSKALVQEQDFMAGDHDPLRSLRLMTRQGHGGVDELRFPQYPGQSIGIS